jgi:hypothetical protein
MCEPSRSPLGRLAERKTATCFGGNMSEVIFLNFWRGIQDEDILNACQVCYSAEFYLMADSRIVCANCETLITSLRTEEIQFK